MNSNGNGNFSNGDVEDKTLREKYSSSAGGSSSFNRYGGRYSGRTQGFKYDYKKTYNYGDDLISRVDAALDSMDFRALNRDISGTVDTAVGIAKEGVEGIVNLTKKYFGPKSTIPAEDPKLVNLNIFYFGKGILMSIFGGVLGFLLVLGSLGIIFNNHTSFDPMMILVLILGILCFITVFFGIKRSTLKKRTKRYLREFGKGTVANINDLASAVNVKRAVAISDIKKLISINALKEGRIVADDSLVLLDNPTYELYKQNLAQQSSKAAQEEAEKQAMSEINEEQREMLMDTIKKGKEYLSALDDLQEVIENKALVEKTQRFEISIKHILKRVEAEPNKVSANRRFIDYYLPTTIKILTSYRDFELTGATSPEIKDAMREIEDIMDTIIDAFQKLLESLFEDNTMDVKSDITVLKSMLNQEGLLDDDMTLK